MCGICGILEQPGAIADRDVLERMIGAIRHRGPDGRGELLDREMALGHVRLSIIDVSGGAQPIGNEDGRLQVVFNGEIYNFVELRDELQSFGHTFRTRSDTEVIVHAYEQWGVDCVRRFNGMFAFALWDSEARSLFVARDHLGVKPLYYTVLGGTLLFASEIKALLQDPRCPREVDVEALNELFTFRYVPSPKTLFKGIFKLPAGHRMTVSRNGMSIDRYWTFVPQAPVVASESELCAQYQELLADAVRLQLRSDVPLGLFLSSGVDSAALLAIMREANASQVRAFTIGFQGGDATNEVADAQAIAKLFEANHEFLMIGPEDYRSYYARYMWDIEEPVGNETAAAFYFVSKVTRTAVKVALTGQGADEPWAGYDRYIGAKLSTYYSQLPAGLTERIAKVVSRIPGRMERFKRSAVALGERDMLTRLAKVYSFFDDGMKSRLFLKNLKAHLHTPAKQALAHLQDDVSDLDALSQMLYIDTRANLPDDLLMVGDKTSMANSLEARVPFLDFRLIEFIESLPGNMKLNGLTGKYLHKKALEKWLPADVVWRKKKGFANPVEHWFRHSMREFVEECLLAGDAGVANYFDQKYIREMLEADRSGREQFRRHIYLLVSFELWYRQFIRGQVAVNAA